MTDQEFEAQKAKLLPPYRWPRERTIWMGVTGLLTAGLIYSVLPGQIPQAPQAEPQSAIAPQVEPPPVAAPQAEPPPAAPVDALLSRIFVPNILDARVEYLESMAGVARSIDKQPRYIGIEGVGRYSEPVNAETRSYTVHGCEIEALIQKRHVSAIAMDVNEKCSFNVGPFFHSTDDQPDLGQANRLRFSDVIRFFEIGRFSSDCLMGCGNAYDPFLRMTVGGSHADSYHQLTIESSSGSLRYDISQSIVAARGEDWVIRNAFGCEGGYDAIAANLAAPEKVERVIVWSHLAPACGSRWPTS